MRKNNCGWSSFTCTIAARYGHFDILKWVIENGCPFDSSTCTNAVESGNLEILKWLREKGCPWDELTCQMAAKKGRLDILKWAHENRCPWDEDTCVEAARKGHLDCLQYAHYNDCEWDEYTCSRAACEGHLDIVKWCIQNRGERLINIKEILELIKYTKINNYYEIKAYLKDQLKYITTPDSEFEWNQINYEEYMESKKRKIDEIDCNEDDNKVFASRSPG